MVKTDTPKGKAALERAGVSPDQVDYVIMGQVIQAGAGQITARQAAVNAGIPMDVPALTINKVCLSGIDAIALADQLIRAGEFEIVVAGGMESMTNAPHLVDLRKGHKYGAAALRDHMATDGLEDAYGGGAMGNYADMIAKEYQFTREQQDAYALETLSRAQSATKEGRFKREITPVTVKGKKGDVTIDTDELPRQAMPEKIPTLRPAFSKDGTVTAANASGISDGAAALVLMKESEAKKRGLTGHDIDADLEGLQARHAARRKAAEEAEGQPAGSQGDHTSFIAARSRMSACSKE